MKIFLFSFSVLFFQISKACHLNRPIVSLSGSVTLALNRLNLLNDEKLLAISIFNPIGEQEKIRRLPGGIYLSRQILQELKDANFIYDESIELNKTLRGSHITSWPVKTRGLTPIEAVEETLEKLSPFLSNCEMEKRKYREEINNKILSIKKKILKKMQMVFFMGEINKNGKYPDLVMSNDGFVKWLRSENLVETYPSDLAYIQWSSKILLASNFKYKVGIKDTGSKLDKKVSLISRGDINLSFPGALIPGEGQIDALLFLLDHLPAVD